jgi:hypothetical protein
LLAAGERLWYEPSAIVHHAVPQKRARRKYFQTWWFGKGRADVREIGISTEVTWYIAGIPLCLFRRLAKAAACRGGKRLIAVPPLSANAVSTATSGTVLISRGHLLVIAFIHRHR